MNDRRLLLELGIALAVKLLLLCALWWMFIRGERVNVDADRIAHSISTPSTLSPSSNAAAPAVTVSQGESNGH